MHLSYNQISSMRHITGIRDSNLGRPLPLVNLQKSSNYREYCSRHVLFQAIPQASLLGLRQLGHIDLVTWKQCSKRHYFRARLFESCVVWLRGVDVSTGGSHPEYAPGSCVENCGKTSHARESGPW